MAKNIPVLVYLENNFGGHSSNVVCDKGVDPVWNIFLFGTNTSGENVNANTIIIDNTGNNASVGVNYGPFSYSVVPYTRKSFPVLPKQDHITITVALGTVPVTIFDFNPGFPDDINQVAATSGASATGGTIWDFSAQGGNFISGGSPRVATYAGNGSLFSAIISSTFKANGSGKWYAEWTYTYAHNNVGLLNNPGIVSTNGDFSSNTNSLIIAANISGSANSVKIGNVDQIVPFVPGPGGIVKIALDATAPNLNVWMGLSGVGANWNGNPAANPATGANPLTLLQTGPFYLYFQALATNSQCTLNCGQSSFADPIPAGFTAWG